MTYHGAILLLQIAQVPDRFVVCGRAYRSIREALAEFIMTGQFSGVTAAVRVICF